MKHIIITLKDITESGGGERVCVNLANAFSESGYKVTIISLFGRNKKPIYNINKDISIQILSSTTPTTKNPLQKLFCKSLYRSYLGRKIDKLICEAKPDIVLANDGWYIPRQKAQNVRYVRLWHLNFPKNMNSRKRTNLNRFDTLAILSKYELPTWQAHHRNIKVIPNFLPTLPTTSTDSAQKVVLSVGRMDEGDQKGFLRLIDIWEIVKQSKDSQGWQLVIVGDGTLKTQIESKIHAKNLQDSITLKPFTKDIESEYLKASIYVMASHFEGFGMVLVEASSYALPCIAFDIPTGPSDIIESSVSGYLIEDNNLKDFATKTLELMNDESKRKALGANARERVSTHFSKEAIIKLWYEILE